LKASFNSKLAMARTCRDTINHSDYEAVIQNGPKAFDAAADELTDLVAQITETAQAQESAKTPASGDRNEALRLLGDCVFELASSLHAYCAANELNDLAICTDLSRTDVTRGTATAVLNRCKDIQKWVTDNLDSLADYKVTQADVTTLKNRIKAFEAVQTKPRTTKANGKAATRRLEAQFTKLDGLLTRRLDKLAVKFKESAPEFYEAYRASRSIVQPSSRAAKDANVVPVAKAA